MGNDAGAQVVLLMRHGAALSAAEDSQRRLSQAGRTHVEMVAGLLANGMVDEVQHSGRARARDTAEILAARLGIPSTRVRERTGILPDDDVNVVGDELESEGVSVALVGHLPFMGRLASRLLTGDAERLTVAFGDAACMVVSRAGRTWRLEGMLNRHLLRDDAGGAGESR